MTLRKYMLDFVVVENRAIHNLYSLLILKPAEGFLPEILPGQFVQVKVDNSPSTYLRRPISVNFVDRENGHLWLLVRKAGAGTEALSRLTEDAVVNLLLPLGNGFTLPDRGARTLLVGGGVGVAPMLYWGAVLREQGFAPEFLLGARSKDDLLELEEFEKYGPVHISTDDGSFGEHGLVTANSAFSVPRDIIYCCGPAPMMKAVAKVAAASGTECEVSLENMMACGLGACLCCVEKTVKGNLCVCTEGPIFNTRQLTW